MVPPAEFHPGGRGAWPDQRNPANGRCARHAGRRALWPAHVKVAGQRLADAVQGLEPGDGGQQTRFAISGLAAAARLELEITESALLADTGPTLATLHAPARNSGCTYQWMISAPDIPSLGYLRSFPFDKIKIDQTFVRELTEKEDCRAIVRAVIGLGRDPPYVHHRGRGRDRRTARPAASRGLRRAARLSVQQAATGERSPRAFAAACTAARKAYPPRSAKVAKPNYSWQDGRGGRAPAHRSGCLGIANQVQPIPLVESAIGRICSDRPRAVRCRPRS